MRKGPQDPKGFTYTSSGEIPPKGGKIHSARGAEILDTTPVEVPLHYRRPETLEEKLKRVVHNELSMAASARDMETFEESDDFDVEDDQDTLPSKYEMTDMQEEQPLMRRANSDVQDKKGRRSESQVVKDKGKAPEGDSGVPVEPEHKED